MVAEIKEKILQNYYSTLNSSEWKIFYLKISVVMCTADGNFWIRMERKGIFKRYFYLFRLITVKDFGYFQECGLYFNNKVVPLWGHLFFMSGEVWRNLKWKLPPTFTSGKNKKFLLIERIEKVSRNHLPLLLKNLRQLKLRTYGWVGKIILLNFSVKMSILWPIWRHFDYLVINSTQKNNIFWYI